MLHDDFKRGPWRYLDFHIIPVYGLSDQTANAQAGWPLLDAHLILSELMCTCREPLTHSYLETCKRVIGKQCRPRSDAT